MRNVKKICAIYAIKFTELNFIEFRLEHFIYYDCGLQLYVLALICI